MGIANAYIQKAESQIPAWLANKNTGRESVPACVIFQAQLAFPDGMFADGPFTSTAHPGICRIPGSRPQ